MNRSQENQRLLMEYAETRDPNIRNQIVMNNVGLVHRCYQMYFASRYPSEDDANELVQAGMLGLITAIERFDAKNYAVLSTYAFPYIRNQMNKLVNPEMPFSEFECEDSDIPMEEQIEDEYAFNQKQSDISDVMEKLLTEGEINVLHTLHRTSNEPPMSVNEIAKELGMTSQKVTELYTSGIQKLSVPCVQWYLRRKGVLNNND